MATIAAKKAAKKWKKLKTTHRRKLSWLRKQSKKQIQNIKAVLNGLVYTADGRIIRRGVGLGHSIPSL